MVGVRSEVRINDKGANVITRISGLADDKMKKFASDIVVKAKQNAAAIPFAESTGELQEKIRFERLDVRRYQIETYSGHASYIEFGTQYIDGKNPFLWPAYRAEKKALFTGGKWV